MTDIQFLFVILSGLYLWECVSWLHRGGVACSSWLGRRWGLIHPTTMFGNQNGGFIFAPPLPPLGSTLFSFQPPISLGPTGLLCFVANNINPGWRPYQSGRFVSWTEVTALTRKGKKLLLDKKCLFAAGTTTRAEFLRQQLQQLAELPPDQRPAAIQNHLRATFDGKALANRWSEFQVQARMLRLLTNTLFALVFVAAPLLIGFVGLKLVWLWLVLALVSLTITTAVLFARLHRKNWPLAEDERFTYSLIIALAPATAMRAVDLLSRPLLENFHPLAVAKHFLAAASFEQYARRVLLDLRNPLQPTCPNPQPEAIATEQFFRRSLLETMEAWLEQHQIDLEKLCRPPQPVDETCRAFCPRCEAQFTTTLGTCADCGGVHLVPFPKVS